MSRTVVIAGGGTGGHIFPGLAVAEQLQAVGVAVHWLGARRGLEAELVGQRGLPLTLVEIEGIHAREPAAAVRALLALPSAIAGALRALLRVQPMAILGVGGYASAAGVLGGGMLGLPWVLQEQNAIPGWTNRLLAPWADLICCGFADAVAEFPSLDAEWTGNPVRSQFFDIAGPALHEPPHLLILGGSQGSLFINRVLPRALAELAATGVRPKVLHQAGVRWAEVVRTAYADLHLEAEVRAFLAEPWTSLARADLIVARSGALTVAELAAAGRAALLIPFAAAAGNHQEHNARSLERAGGAVVLHEHDATPARVAAVLGELMAEPNRIGAMAENTRSFALPDAARRIAEKVIAVGGGA
ncbi:MAG: undecaprenyldiphospho-muramoylpentapeptide beta-N-acetylglucosaminyltransferase [Acidobacteria bacterium]|nr:undecaprenyldiphospho-muramoylpentapeptide beta-N-acetylglucosaminyltransferase [Acidobacteriota bacterium]